MSGRRVWGRRSRIALRRDDIDLDGRTVSIRRQYVELSGQLVPGPPKSRAGIRMVGIPAAIIPELRDHLAAYVGPQETDLVFAGSLGGVLRRGNFRRDSGWAAAVGKLGVPGVHFHDLRHTGNMLAEMSRVASDASFRRIRECAWPAVLFTAG